MKAKVINSPSYTFKKELIGNTYEVDSIDEEDVWLIIDHQHDPHLQYEAGSVWRFDLAHVQFIEEKEKPMRVKVLSGPGYSFDRQIIGNVYDVVKVHSNGSVMINIPGRGRWNLGTRHIEVVDASTPVTDRPNVPRVRKPKQKPKKTEQTKVFIHYADGSTYVIKRVKEAVVHAKDKQLHVTSSRYIGSITIRENISIPFKTLADIHIQSPDNAVTYFFDGNEVGLTVRYHDESSPFQTHIW